MRCDLFLDLFFGFQNFSEELKRFLGFLFIELGDGEPGMEDNPIADTHIVQELKAGADFRALVINFSDIWIGDLDDFNWNP